MGDTTSTATLSPLSARPRQQQQEDTIQDKWLYDVRRDVNGMLGKVELQWREEQSGHYTMEGTVSMCRGLEDSRFNGQTNGPPTANLQKPHHAMRCGVWTSVTDALEGQGDKKCWAGFFEDTSEMEIKTGPQSVELRIKPSGRYLQRIFPDKTEYIQSFRECTVTGKPVKVIGTWMGTTVDGDTASGEPGHWDWGRVIEPDENEESAKTRAPGSRRSKGISWLTGGLKKVLCAE